MKAYDSLLKKISPIGLYSLTNDSAVVNELKTFAAGINNADHNLDLIIREEFIPTALDYGLSMWEEIFGEPQSDVSAQLRREMLIKRLNLNSGSFTAERAVEILNSLGVTDFTITEMPSLFTVVIDLGAQPYSAAQKRRIRDQLAELLPAHLEIIVVFGNITWDRIDSLALTAQQMDGKNYTWEQIDDLKY